MTEVNEREKKAGELRGDPWGELLPGELGEQNPEGTIRDVTAEPKAKGGHRMAISRKCPRRHQD